MPDLTKDEERLVAGAGAFGEVADHPGVRFLLQIIKDHVVREENNRTIMPRQGWTLGEEVAYHNGRLDMGYEIQELPEAVLRQVDAITSRE